MDSTGKGKGRAASSSSPLVSSSSDSDRGGIALTVTPASSAFFSGEALVFELKFTNTRAPRAIPTPTAATSTPGSLSGSGLRYASLRHAPSGASSAPASRSQFPSPTPSPARSYVDLSATNSSGTSSHLVLPERRGVIGTPLALSAHFPHPRYTDHHFQNAASGPPSASSPAVSPVFSTSSRRHQPPAPASAAVSPDRTPQNQQQQQQQQSASLYSQRRLPAAHAHKKNDYSVSGGVMLMREAAEEDQDDGGVSDLSSQLAGQAILHERESSVEVEDGILDARPYVEQYKRRGDALGERIPSIGRRAPSGFSTISEEAGNSEAGSPPKRLSPTRSLSYSSVASTATRVPSSSTVFGGYDGYSPSFQHGTDFYGLSQSANESVDSVLRDTMTRYARPALQHSRSATRSHLPQLRPSAAAAHGRSYSSASTPHPHTAPLQPGRAALDAPDAGFGDSGTETLLWAFAQFAGSFTVEEALIKNGEFVAMKQSLFGGSGKAGGSSHLPGTGAGHAAFGGAGMSAIGGGSLDSQPEELASPGTVSGRLASWIWGSTSSSGSGKQAAYQADSRRPSSSGSHLTLPVDPILDGSGRRRSGVGNVQAPLPSTAPTVGSLEERRNRAMNDSSYPVFNSPPSILAVDLVLEPGESKTYTFTLQLPGDLPPSFRGKAISFTYTLLVGTNRAPNGASGEYRQQSRMVRVPVRIYNNVSMSGVRPFYDLTNPIVWTRDEAKITTNDDAPSASGDILTPSGRQQRSRQRSSSIETAYAAARKHEQKLDFQDYASKLLEASFASPEVSPRDEMGGGRRSSRSASPLPELEKERAGYADGGPGARPELMQRTMSASSHAMANGAVLGDDGEDTSCKSAVEIVSRNAQKVSYDINKDGFRIATLTLVKSAYRLGDTVTAMITLNNGKARVLRLAARLETQELVETTVSVKSSSQVRQLTRRLHAEHHETTLDSGRVSFALAIPSGATPDFATSGVKLQWSLRVSFLILPPPPEQPRYGHDGQASARTSPTMVRGMSHSATPSSALSPTAGVRPQHNKSKSFAFMGSSPTTPVPVDSGGSHHHLLPVAPIGPHQQYTSYRAVPDLSFVPTLFQTPEAQEQAQLGSPALGGLSGSGSGAGAGTGTGVAKREEAVVLMPAKIETVEIAVPLRVYPSATPFRAPVSSFRV